MLRGRLLHRLSLVNLRFSTIRSFSHFSDEPATAQAPEQEQLAVPPLVGYQPRYIDIGVNLADPKFRGRYNKSRKHDDDLADVIDRARQVGCNKVIVTGSSGLFSARSALDLTQEYDGTCYSAVGIDPSSSVVFARSDIRTQIEADQAPRKVRRTDPMPEQYLPDPMRTEQAIDGLISMIDKALSVDQPRLVALGKFGLDYNNLIDCNRAIQKASFAAQLDIAMSLPRQLPLILYSRAAHADFVALLKTAFGSRLENLMRGAVVHSFIGSQREAEELMELGLYIGISGCSFKYERDCEVVNSIPLDRIMLGTDGPLGEIHTKDIGYKYMASMNHSTSTTEDTQSEQDIPLWQIKQEMKRKRKKINKAKKKKNRNLKEGAIVAVPERFDAARRKGRWKAGLVRGRNEPCAIEVVAQIVAALKGISVEEVCEAAWRNTNHVFGLDKS